MVLWLCFNAVELTLSRPSPSICVRTTTVTMQQNSTVSRRALKTNFKLII